MDFHAAMETFTEAWVAANTHTAVNPAPSPSQRSSTPADDDLPTMVPRESFMRMGGGLKPTPGFFQPINMTTSTISGLDGVKSMPIHCVVEQLSTCDDNSPKGGISAKIPSANGGTPVVELDTYAILPGTTMFSEIVRTALMRIGYTASEAVGAKGAVQIKNWKPLSFDTITENPNSTLDEILGDLTSFATLRIRLCRGTLWKTRIGISAEKMQNFRMMMSNKPLGDNFTRDWTDEMVRCAVIDLLTDINQSTLAKLSPLSQSTISNIANSKYMATISLDKCRDFGQWYAEYKTQKDNICNEISSKDQAIRLTFHPMHELPKMRIWFETFRNPTDEMFQGFVDEINNGSVRKQRKPISAKHMKIWWRNEKVRQKRLRDSEGKEPAIKRRGRPKKPADLESQDQFHQDPSTSQEQESQQSGDENFIILERSPSLGSPGEQSAMSPTNLNTGPSQRPSYPTIDRHALPTESPVYPIPYVQLSESTRPRINDTPLSLSHNRVGMGEPYFGVPMSSSSNHQKPQPKPLSMHALHQIHYGN